MRKIKGSVPKSIIRTQDYGLSFRYQYDVQPGYGKTGDVIRVTGWFNRPKLSERARE